jgi:hypothetical protein
MWKDILKRLYEQGKVDSVVLDNCVNAGLITSAEKDEITGV